MLLWYFCVILRALNTVSDALVLLHSFELELKNIGFQKMFVIQCIMCVIVLHYRCRSSEPLCPNVPF